jgi:hypothetical protein
MTFQCLPSLVSTLCFVTARSRQVAFVHELNSIKEHWATLKDEESRSAYAKERRAFKEAVNEVRIHGQLDRVTASDLIAY